MEIYVYDGNTEDIKIKEPIDDFISLIWTDRHIALGNFKLVVTDTAYYRNLLAAGNYLKIPQSEFTMITETQEAEKGLLTVTGRAAASMLDRRIVLQTFPVKPPKLTDYISQLVADNISDWAILPERRIPWFWVWFNIPSGFTKQTGYEQISYGDNLLEAVNKICKDVNLGFRVDIEHPRIGFWLYFGTDRTKTTKKVIFRLSDESVDNLSTIKGNATEKNVAFVNLPPASGQGLGEIKKVVRSDGVWNQGLNRREIWTSASQLRQDPNFNGHNKDQLLTTWGRTVLAKNNRVYAMDFSIAPNARFTYRKDYFMGDIVGILEDGAQTPVPYQVVEYIHSYSAGNISSYPTLSKWEDR